MTPDVRLALKVLAMSSVEVEAELTQAREENPLLEEVAEEHSEAPSDTSDSSQTSREGETPDWATNEFIAEYLGDNYRPQLPRETTELPSIEHTLAASLSLADSLNEQLHFRNDDTQIRTIASAVIGNLDDRGYLEASLAEIAALGPWPLDDVAQGLALVQALDPAGVGARDLRECLWL